MRDLEIMMEVGMKKNKTLYIVGIILLLFILLVGCSGLKSGGDTDYLVLVNSDNKLPDNWEETIVLETVSTRHGNLKAEKETFSAFLELQEACEKSGVTIEVCDAYRSVEEQETIVRKFTEKYGEEYVRQYVAVPGYSEHHTGLAIDVHLIVDGNLIEENDDLMECEEEWEIVHSKLADYGFILRFPEGKEEITGIEYEPWHIRYVGSSDIAQEIASKGITLEEYVSDVK